MSPTISFSTTSQLIIIILASKYLFFILTKLKSGAVHLPPVERSLWTTPNKAIQAASLSKRLNFFQKN